MPDEDLPNANESVTLAAAMAGANGDRIACHDPARVIRPHDEHSCRHKTDQVLAAAVVVDHDDAAYAELYRRHCGSVAAGTRMILGADRPGCDDVVADVFVEFWLSPEKFDPNRGSLLGFLRMKARGRSLDLLRSEAQRKRREDGDFHTGRCPAPDIDTALIASETATSLRHALTALPTGEAEAINLAFFAGMSYTEVARQLGLAEGTVKSRVRKGLRRLRFNHEVQLHHQDDRSLPLDPLVCAKSAPTNDPPPT